MSTCYLQFWLETTVGAWPLLVCPCTVPSATYRVSSARIIGASSSLPLILSPFFLSSSYRSTDGTCECSFAVNSVARRSMGPPIPSPSFFHRFGPLWGYSLNNWSFETTALSAILKWSYLILCVLYTKLFTHVKIRLIMNYQKIP